MEAITHQAVSTNGSPEYVCCRLRHKIHPDYGIYLVDGLNVTFMTVMNINNHCTNKIKVDGCELYA